MGRNTTENLIAEMESTNYLMTSEMTTTEYLENLEGFQRMILEMVMGDDYCEGMRLDEAIFRLESRARTLNMSSDPRIRKGIEALRKVNREIAISFSGKRGEDFVARTLNYLQRPDASLYRNIYIADGIEETEIDTVITTNRGIILLEIKKAKDDLTISEDGRLFHNGKQSYEKRPIIDKMSDKRRLLKSKMEKEMKKNGLDVPIHIDSYIIFTTPKGTRIKVQDNCRQEAWCFRTGINNRIENYEGPIKYTDFQLQKLNSILNTMESDKRKNTVPIDSDEIRRSIASAMTALNDCCDNGEKNMICENEQIKKKAVVFPMVGNIVSAVLLSTAIITKGITTERKPKTA